MKYKSFIIVTEKGFESNQSPLPDNPVVLKRWFKQPQNSPESTKINVNFKYLKQSMPFDPYNGHAPSSLTFLSHHHLVQPTSYPGHNQF